jgi:hypothetical protein
MSKYGNIAKLALKNKVSKGDDDVESNNTSSLPSSWDSVPELTEIEENGEDPFEEFYAPEKRRNEVESELDFASQQLPRFEEVKESVVVVDDCFYFYIFVLNIFDLDTKVFNKLKEIANILSLPNLDLDCRFLFFSYNVFFFL